MIRSPDVQFDYSTVSDMWSVTVRNSRVGAQVEQIVAPEYRVMGSIQWLVPHRIAGRLAETIARECDLRVRVN